MSEVRGCLLLAAFGAVWGVLGGFALAVWGLASGAEPGAASVAVSVVIGLLAAVAGFALLDRFLARPASTPSAEGQSPTRFERDGTS